MTSRKQLGQPRVSARRSRELHSRLGSTAQRHLQCCGAGGCSSWDPAISDRESLPPTPGCLGPPDSDLPSLLLKAVKLSRDCAKCGRIGILTLEGKGSAARDWGQASRIQPLPALSVNPVPVLGRCISVTACRALVQQVLLQVQCMAPGNACRQHQQEQHLGIVAAISSRSLRPASRAEPL